MAKLIACVTVIFQSVYSDRNIIYFNAKAVFLSLKICVTAEILVKSQISDNEVKKHLSKELLWQI